MQIKTNFLMMMGFLLIAINVQAGEIGPRLQAELQLQSLWISPAFTQDIPVVVTFKDKANISVIRDKHRKQRIRKAIRLLKNKSKSVQNSVRQMLYTHWIDRVDDLWLINGLAFKASPALLKILAALPEVDVVELDYQIKAPATGSGGSAPAEWNLDMIGAPLLWDIGITGHGVVVANMDTGVDRTDPDINFAWRNGDNSWFDPNCQPFPPQLPDANFDDSGCPNSAQIDLSQPRDSAGNSTGHGTETMGVMVGGQASGTSIGVAPDAKWIATKIFNDSGIAFQSRIHLAFQWLLNPDNDLNTDDAPDVVNASWVLAGTDVGKCVPEFQTDIQNLKSAGIAVVFAAGNNGANGTPNTSTSPGNNPAGYAVGAIDMGGLVASFSSRGPAPLALALDGTDCNDGLFPELVAPGVSITTTKTDVIFGGAQYSSVSGTSFAAPHVAGAMALLKSRIPTITVAQLESTLLQSAVQTIPDTILGPDDNYGYGALNVANAYEVICPATGPDSDGDGVPDACDNCMNISNGPLTSVNGTLISLGQIQLDTDRDGYGNACDADYNQNCVVDISDFIQFRNVFGTSDNEADFNMSGSVDITDFIIFRNTFGNGPGISGQAPVPDAQNCHL